MNVELKKFSLVYVLAFYVLYSFRGVIFLDRHVLADKQQEYFVDHYLKSDICFGERQMHFVYKKLSALKKACQTSTKTLTILKNNLLPIAFSRFATLISAFDSPLSIGVKKVPLIQFVSWQNEDFFLIPLFKSSNKMYNHALSMNRLNP